MPCVLTHSMFLAVLLVAQFLCLLLLFGAHFEHNLIFCTGKVVIKVCFEFRERNVVTVVEVDGSEDLV
jgi:hypothetical protein